MIQNYIEYTEWAGFHLTNCEITRSLSIVTLSEPLMSPASLEIQGFLRDK